MLNEGVVGLLCDADRVRRKDVLKYQEFHCVDENLLEKYCPVGQPASLWLYTD